MSSDKEKDIVTVKALTNWRASKSHKWRRKGDVFDVPAESLPSPHLEKVDSGN